MFYVYLITNIVNGSIYIGKTNDLRGRLSDHKSKARLGCQFILHHAIRKYGEENFTIDALEQYESEQDAFDAETELISIFKYIGARLYNMTDGGEGVSGRVWTEEQRKKTI